MNDGETSLLLSGDLRVPGLVFEERQVGTRERVFGLCAPPRPLTSALAESALAIQTASDSRMDGLAQAAKALRDRALVAAGRWSNGCTCDAPSGARGRRTAALRSHGAHWVATSGGRRRGAPGGRARGTGRPSNRIRLRSHGEGFAGAIGCNNCIWRWLCGRCTGPRRVPRFAGRAEASRGRVRILFGLAASPARQGTHNALQRRRAEAHCPRGRDCEPPVPAPHSPRWGRAPARFV